MADEPLVFKDGRAIVGDAIGVTMLITPKEDTDKHGVTFRYFEYVSNFMQPKQRVEWDVEGMHAVLPRDTADFLIKRRYARDMFEHEVEAYNKAAPPPETNQPATDAPKIDAPPADPVEQQQTSQGEPDKATEVRPDASQSGEAKPMAQPKASGKSKRGERQ
jgi:hypothetical protein